MGCKAGRQQRAYWLRNTLPRARPVVEVENAPLFFPKDRPDALTTPLLKFWSEQSR